MDTQKSKIGRFFDTDSAEYLEHKYAASQDSFMARRREKAAALLRDHVAPSFNEHFEFLDCGCGPGILLEVLSGYNIRYCGFDLSEQMLRLARKQPAVSPSGLTRRQFIQGDVENLPFRTASFDAIASLGVIEYLETDDRLLAEIVRIVKPGGHVLIAVTNRRSYNLALEKPLDVLRTNRVTASVLDVIKRGLGLGQFRQMEFEKRRHAVREFTDRVAGHDVRILATSSWGFNLLPHPLHYLCGQRLNGWANGVYEKSAPGTIKNLGEGFMVLCQRN